MNIQESFLRFDQLSLGDASFENPRTTTGLSIPEIVEIAETILDFGILVPLLVRTDHVVIGGQRRYRALALLHAWVTGDMLPLEARHALAPTDPDVDQARAIRVKDILMRIPVRVITLGARDPTDYNAIAVMENLIRSDLSSFEIARALSRWSADGKTGVAIARMIGKSTGYVSRKLSTWRGAGPELRTAWEKGEIEESLVHELSQLPVEQQAKAVAGPVPRGRRGPAHRPSVDAVRDFLHELEQKPREAYAADRVYRDGVIDALRWAIGATSSPAFADLASPKEE